MTRLKWNQPCRDGRIRAVVERSDWSLESTQLVEDMLQALAQILLYMLGENGSSQDLQFPSPISAAISPFFFTFLILLHFSSIRCTSVAFRVYSRDSPGVHPPPPRVYILRTASVHPPGRGVRSFLESPQIGWKRRFWPKTGMLLFGGYFYQYLFTQKIVRLQTKPGLSFGNNAFVGHIDQDLNLVA